MKSTAEKSVKWKCAKISPPFENILAYSPVGIDTVVLHSEEDWMI